MYIIGVTGGIGSGKSTVAKILQTTITDDTSEANYYGVPIIDADKIARNVTDVDGLALAEIEETFGKDAIKDNKMDRKYISNIVFNDSEKLKLLNDIVHKYVVQEIMMTIAWSDCFGCPYVILDVPIPVKHGFIDVCDEIWSVTCEREERIKRIVKRGLDEENAKKRIAAQMSDEEYKKIGKVLINNSGSVEELTEKIKTLVQDNQSIK